jgi:hypothetical protein
MAKQNNRRVGERMCRGGTVADVMEMMPKPSNRRGKGTNLRSDLGNRRTSEGCTAQGLAGWRFGAKLESPFISVIPQCVHDLKCMTFDFSPWRSH